MIPRRIVMTLLLFVWGLALVGCNKDNPGTWPQDKVSAKVQESLDVSGLTLTSDPAGGFSGTGKRTDGETLTITVTQDADAHRLSWSAKGDRGTVEDGFFELK